MDKLPQKATRLIASFEDKTAKIGVVGLGYVGLPLLLRFCDAGYDVVGLDVDQKKVASLTAGRSYIQHIASSRIDAFKHKFSSTTNFEELSECDALIVCVPTPLLASREPDLSYITDTVSNILPYLNEEGVVLSLESTTYPGTTEEIVGNQIAEFGKQIGTDLFLVYSPEREDPGRTDFTTQTIPKLVAGSTEACLSTGLSLYANVIDELVPTNSLKVAEMAKILENAHRAVNIALVNEMKILADALEVDIFEVLEAAATKPFGLQNTTLGPGWEVIAYQSIPFI